MADRRLERQGALAALCEAEGVAGLVVQSLPNIRYLTGFSGSAGLCLVGRGQTVLITDFRYATQAPQESATVARVEVDQVNIWDRLKRVAAGAPGPWAFESHVATVAELERLTAALGARPEPRAGLVERLRERKAPEEVAAIRAAGALAEEALAEVVATVRVGESELVIGARLEEALRRRGSEWHPFPTIVASGPRSALPHARTSPREVGRGEFLLVDFGAQLGGYCSDITRTFVVGGAPDERQRAVYEVVEEAARRAREGVRAGMTGREGDQLARKPIAERGYGEAFGHSLGHGLGLEVHEAPRLSPTAEGVLPAGAVVTIEPGVYLPGWGGVRLEDDVVLHPEGAESLTHFERSLTILG
ncbi:MAG TPA: aminopeptidase P family protein [Gemmatimonadales bacterium]|nr:aminopeptidase P family protein [Gemmatimonadales bacterium]